MAQDGINGKSLGPLHDQRLVILSNAATRRTAELRTLHAHIKEDGLTDAESQTICRTLFDTLPIYIDMKSRHAVEDCIIELLAQGGLQGQAELLTELSVKESNNRGLASGSALVLTRWLYYFFPEAGKTEQSWKKWGSHILLALARSTDTFYASDPRRTTDKTIVRVMRRAFRKLLSTPDRGEPLLRDCVTILAGKPTSPSPQNGFLLGILAEVSARMDIMRPVLESLKAHYNDFYIRELLGSKFVLPDYQAKSLSPYFANFISALDLEGDLLGPIEKSLLRAPEITLVNTLPSTIESLAPDVDLAQIVSQRLLGPVLKSAISSNPTIKTGAVRTFKACSKHLQDQPSINRITSQVLDPLRQGKLTSADHRAVYAQLLETLPRSAWSYEKIPAGLSPILTKEANETAAASEIGAYFHHLRYISETGSALDSTATDALIKGLADKKLPIRRMWTGGLAKSLWDLSVDHLKSPAAETLITKVTEKLFATWKDANDNPLPAVTSGLMAAAFSSTAICAGKVGQSLEAKDASYAKWHKLLEESLRNTSKPAFLLNPKVYTKYTSGQDLTWFLRAIESVTPIILSPDTPRSVKISWTQAFIYTLVYESQLTSVHNEASLLLTRLYGIWGLTIAQIMIEGCIQWALDDVTRAKDSTPMISQAGTSVLKKVFKNLHADHNAQSEQELDQQALSMLIIARPEIVPQANWIERCLRLNIDPGQFSVRNADACIAAIKNWTEDTRFTGIESFQAAAYAAAADLAFVSPEALLPRIIDQVCADLDTSRLNDIGPTEAAIYRTSPDTTFVDVLASQAPPQPPSKNSKDYDTLSWEAELRDQLAKKKGQPKKLTKDEQVKVNAQLAKEAEIRQQVSDVVTSLRRGAGTINGLIRGPPTDIDAWFGRCTQSLFDVIVGGAGLLLGETVAETYLELSNLTSARLGAMRPFVGAIALRAANVVAIPSRVAEEPLGEAVTRILYRLRSLGEQRPFDPVSLAYALQVVFIVLEQGAVDKSGDEADEQLILAGEFLSFHTDVCGDVRLPRARILSSIIRALQNYTSHFRLFKDALNDFSRGIAATLGSNEADVITKATIVPQATVRTAALQAISAELELHQQTFIKEIWVACHDDLQENVELAQEIWEENELLTHDDDGIAVIPYLESTDSQLRRASARALADLVRQHPTSRAALIKRLEDLYLERAKARMPQRDKYGMPIKTDLEDPWASRHGIALAFKELAESFQNDDLETFFDFLTRSGPLADRSAAVREAMLDAATSVVTKRGQLKVEELMTLFESSLDGSASGAKDTDLVNEAVVIMYGALARHLPTGDQRLPKVVQRLLQTLSTPSESVQYAVAQCLPPLVQASSQQAPEYVQKMMEELLTGKKYAVRRGAAYGLAGIVKGRGISAFREMRIMSNLKAATENKKDTNQRQGSFLAYELLSLVLGRVFEPYVITIVPQLLGGFADTSADVREACLDAAKTSFSTLSSFGVKQILPTLLEGLDDSQWRSKKGACDSLGAMAYLDPEQLAISLPQIIPRLTEVLNDSHKEVRASANRSLQRFGEVISNPEIKSQVDILLKALSDPTKYTDNALDALIKVNFTHYLDAPSLALVVRILERGLGDRSSTKRKASQIIGSLAHLTDRKDLTSHLPVLVAGLRIAVVDPVPATRATSSKALGSLVEKLGEDALPDLIPSLMTALKSDSGAGDRLGSAQALSEVLAGLGTGRLEETLPTILQNVSSSRPTIREGFMSLFIFLPATFGNSFANYLSRVISPILGGISDEIESIRETSLRAGRLLVKNFATRSIDLLLPELERGLADDNYRTRLSSVELVGDLLFNLTGISGKTEQDEEEEDANEAGQSLLEVLGEEKRNKVLSALYICRCDTSGLVRAAAINVWKALVSTPRTLRELVPTLTQLLVRRLASSNMEQKVIAGNALGELIRKAGENVLATLLPTLEEGLQTSTDTDARQGICIALRELISSASPEGLEDYEKTLISVVRTALVDSDAEVREAAAEAFDSLQKIFGKKAIDQVLPHLLNLLRSDDGAENALSALLTLLTEQTRANVILPNLLPTLLATPISAFNARALASLAEVAGTSMTRRLPNIVNTLMDTIISSKDETLRAELDSSFDAILLSVDEYDGLNTLMSVILALIKHDDHRRRAAIDLHLIHFFETAEQDISRYYPDLIRALLLSFDDRDSEVVKAAWAALSALTDRLKKEEMESLVASTRQTLNQVGVAGHDLPGFSLPKGIKAILPLFLQGLMNGTAEQRTQAALAISDIVDRTSAEGLKPFVATITGPLIRVVSERSIDVKCAILLSLNNLLEKIPTLLKPFLPQLQRTFAKSLADPSSELLRTRAAKALGTLITLTPRIDPLITELVTGSKTADSGVRNAMLKALYEVVSKAGANMNEGSKNAILGLIDAEPVEGDDGMIITNARLLGALIKVLPADSAAGLIRNRVLTTNFKYSSILSLNAVLLSSPGTFSSNPSFLEHLPNIVSQGIKHPTPEISENAVLAAGKYLMSDSIEESEDQLRSVLETLAGITSATSNASVDTRRLALVVLRTFARTHLDLITSHLSLLVGPVFSVVRDPLIPIKLAAEQAFLSIFDVIDSETEHFDAFITGEEGAKLPPNTKRSMQDYFRRVATRLGAQGRERRESEGKGQGEATSEEEEDEREIWSVGRVEIGEAWREG